jgi:hypothetical protein
VPIKPEDVAVALAPRATSIPLATISFLKTPQGQKVTAVGAGAGALAGATAGAMFGSVVPVFGTILGAGIGATVGVITSLIAGAGSSHGSREASFDTSLQDAEQDLQSGESTISQAQGFLDDAERLGPDASPQTQKDAQSIEQALQAIASDLEVFNKGQAQIDPYGGGSSARAALVDANKRIAALAVLLRSAQTNLESTALAAHRN